MTNDGEVVPLSNKASSFTNVPEDIQGDVVDIALTDESAAALTSDGRVHTWGNNVNHSMDVPEDIQGRVTALSAGRYHYTAILDDGTVAFWGDNTFGQDQAPHLNGKAVSVSAGYYSSYAIMEDGNAKGWGLDGYLMGTDNLGRDVFRRLIVGGRMTMTVGAIAVIISTFIGVIVGGVSGYKGGKLDNLLMRLTEIVSPVPFLPFCIILSSILGNSISEMITGLSSSCSFWACSPGRALPGCVLRQRAGRAGAGVCHCSQSPGRKGIWHYFPAHPAQHHHSHHCQRHPGLCHLHADRVFPVLYWVWRGRAQRHLGQYAQRRPERAGH